MKKIRSEKLLFLTLAAAVVFSVGILFPKTASANEPSTSSTSCNAGETCKSIDANGYGPVGYDCTFRGVCPGTNTACCIADSSDTVPTPPATAAPATTTATTSKGSSCGGVSSGTTFTNPLSFCSVEDFLGNFLTVMQTIIVTLALVFIVIGAIIYVTSAGDSKRIESAKQAITAALIGLAIAIGAPSILKQLSSILGWNTTNNATVNKALTFSQIATNLLTFLLGIFGVLAIIMMVIGGIMYLTSAGDEDRIDSGKKIFKYAIFGTVIAMAAMVLVRQIAVFFT